MYEENTLNLLLSPSIHATAHTMGGASTVSTVIAPINYLGVIHRLPEEILTMKYTQDRIMGGEDEG